MNIFDALWQTSYNKINSLVYQIVYMKMIHKKKLITFFMYRYV